jgi:hypothetical protein
LIYKEPKAFYAIGILFDYSKSLGFEYSKDSKNSVNNVDNNDGTYSISSKLKSVYI